MTALQELSIRLSMFTRSLHLSTLREASGHLYRRHRSLHVRVYSSSPCRSSLPVADSYFTVPLFTGASHRHLSAGRDDLKLGALERSDRGPSTTDDLLFGDFKISDDDADPPSGSLVSDGSGYVKYVEDGPTKEPQTPNYLTMSDKQLFAKCRMDTYRASGPGGQHRNKTDSAVRLTHIPTGLVAQAADDRSQHINRSLALTRLRQTIALEGPLEDVILASVRDTVELDGYKPPLEFVRILPSGTGRRRGNSQRIGPNHPDFILGMKALMDLLYATGGSISDAAKALGLSTGALSKLITSNNLLWQGVNKLRAVKVFCLALPLLVVSALDDTQLYIVSARETKIDATVTDNQALFSFLPTFEIQTEYRAVPDQFLRFGYFYLQTCLA